MKETTWVDLNSPETKVLTLRSVFEGQPILFVEHDANGDWHFYDSRQVFGVSEVMLAPLKRVLELDPSLQELANLPTGWRAGRQTPTTSWERESSTGLEKTRARSAQALEELRRKSITLTATSPSTTELLREDRNR